MTLSSDGKSLTSLTFCASLEIQKMSDNEHIGGDLPVFEQTIRWLDIYFKGERPDFMPPLKPVGSDFQKDVWNILLTIPYGKTMTYGEVASIVAAKRNIPRMSAQAVGGAIGSNPIAIIVPCHRVIGANGKLTGYAAGLYKKQKLLEIEGVTTF